MKTRTVERIRRRLEKKRHITPQGCWEWLGALDHVGYGKTCFWPYQYISPHRLAMMVFRGEWRLLDRKSVQVRHACDNKKCFNPDHMTLGGWFENFTDWSMRGPFVDTAHEQGAKKRVAAGREPVLKSSL